MTASDLIETTLTIPAASIAPGDLLFYTAAEAWRIESTELFGKSVDVVFTHEQSAIAVGYTDTHRFRQSTSVIVRRAAGVEDDFVEPPITVPAFQLAIGDVVHYNAQSEWQITSLEAVGKSIRAGITYLRSNNEPGRVGTADEHRFRGSTNLLVTRAA